jgi:hypothetical protein
VHGRRGCSPVAASCPHTRWAHVDLTPCAAGGRARPCAWSLGGETPNPSPSFFDVCARRRCPRLSCWGLALRHRHRGQQHEPGPEGCVATIVTLFHSAAACLGGFQGGPGRGWVGEGRCATLEASPYAGPGRTLRGACPESHVAVGVRGMRAHRCLIAALLQRRLTCACLVLCPPLFVLAVIIARAYLKDDGVDLDFAPRARPDLGFDGVELVLAKLAEPAPRCGWSIGRLPQRSAAHMRIGIARWSRCSSHLRARACGRWPRVRSPRLLH